MKPENVKDWGDQWKDVEFGESINVVEIERGRSAAHYKAFSKKTNSFYTIFITDFLDMAINGDVKKSKISGVFIVTKKGTNFGIRLKGTPKKPKFKHPNYKNRLNRPIPEYI